MNEEVNEVAFGAQHEMTFDPPAKSQSSSEDNSQNFVITSTNKILELEEQKPSAECFRTTLEKNQLDAKDHEISTQLNHSCLQNNIQEFDQSKRTQKNKNNRDVEFKKNSQKKSNSAECSNISNFTIQQRKKPQQHGVTGYHDTNRKQYTSHQIFNGKYFRMMTPIKSSNSIVSVPFIEQRNFSQQKLENGHANSLMAPPKMQRQPNAFHSKQSSIAFSRRDVYKTHNKYLDYHKTLENGKNFQQNVQDFQKSKQTQKNQINNKDKSNDEFKYLNQEKALPSAKFVNTSSTSTIHNTLQQQNVLQQKIQHGVTAYHDTNRKHTSHQIFNGKYFRMMTPIKSSNSIVSVSSIKQQNFSQQKIENVHANSLIAPLQMQRQPNAVHPKQSLCQVMKVISKTNELN